MVQVPAKLQTSNPRNHEADKTSDQQHVIRVQEGTYHHYLATNNTITGENAEVSILFS